MTIKMALSWKEYAGLDATGLADLLASGDVSARELAYQARAAVGKVNPAINAVVELFEDAIVEPQLNEGPFMGVPMMLKDLGSKMKGRAQEAGYGLLNGCVAEEDDPLTANFKSAGFNLIGRTTTPEDGMAGVTETIGFGITRNPWDLTRSSGGSSGGSAALVAAGALAVCSASDGAGSIRLPAAWTGLIGLKTTRGRLPLPTGANEATIPSASEGIVTRTVRDTARVHELLCRRDMGIGFMPYREPSLLSPSLVASHRKLRIAVSVSNWSRSDNMPSDGRDAVLVVADWLANKGHEVVWVEEQQICDFEQVYASFKIANWVAPLGRWIPEMAAACGVTLTTKNTSNQTLQLIEAAKKLSLGDFLEAIETNATTTLQWSEFWRQGFDLLLTPTLGDICSKVESRYALSSPAPFDEFFDHSLDLCRYTLPANDAGLPAISLPAGLDRNSCPLGVQFYAPWCGESDLISIAAAMERDMPHYFSQLAPLNVMTTESPK